MQNNYSPTAISLIADHIDGVRKMLEVNKLTGGMREEIDQKLTAARTLLEIFRNQTPEEPSLLEVRKTIDECIYRGGFLIVAGRAFQVAEIKLRFDQPISETLPLKRYPNGDSTFARPMRIDRGATLSLELFDRREPR